MKKILLFVSVFLLVSNQVWASIYYVGISGTGDGSTSDTPSADLADILSRAGMNDTVYVSAGEYKGSFKVGTKITLLGDGYAVLDGEYSQRALEMDTLAVCEGLIIRNGLADIGGGVFVKGGVLRNCVVETSSATTGGGVYARYAIVEGCLIQYNKAADGGGIYVDGTPIVNCTIVKNTGWSIGSVVVENGIKKGVVFSVDSWSYTIVALQDINGTYQWGNETTIMSDGSYSPLANEVDAELDMAGYMNTANIRQKLTTSSGYAAEVVDFANGWALPALGQLKTLYSFHQAIANLCSDFIQLSSGKYWSSTLQADPGFAWAYEFSNPTASAAPAVEQYSIRPMKVVDKGSPISAASSAIIYNCAFWGNDTQIYQLQYHIIWNTAYEESDPSNRNNKFISSTDFVDADHGNFRIRHGSQLIDAGDQTLLHNPEYLLDLNRNQRIYNSEVDMGAFEYYPVWTARAEPFTEGDGSESNPYHITSAEQLAYLASGINLGTIEENQFYQLQNDIDLSSLYDLEWEPIGATRKFTGTFLGNNHQINNIQISKATAASNFAVGLFGVVENATIRDLTVAGGTIGDADIPYAGGIVGYAGGQWLHVTNCTNKASITGNGGIIGFAVASYVEISDCLNEGAITPPFTNGGGIIGILSFTDAKVENCTNTGTISSMAVNTGGIVGHLYEQNNYASQAIIANCVNKGDISVEGSTTRVGGIIGGANSIWNEVPMNILIMNCDNEGIISVLGTPGTSTGVGGIVGFAGSRRADAPSPLTINLTQCSNNGNVTGPDAGGIIGNTYALGQTKINASKSYNYGKIGVSNGIGVAGGAIGKTSGTVTLQSLYWRKDTINTSIAGIGTGATAEQNSHVVALTASEFMQKENFDKDETRKPWTDFTAKWNVGQENSAWTYLMIEASRPRLKALYPLDNPQMTILGEVTDLNGALIGSGLVFIYKPGNQGLEALDTVRLTAGVFTFNMYVDASCIVHVVADGYYAAYYHMERSVAMWENAGRVTKDSRTPLVIKMQPTDPINLTGDDITIKGHLDYDKLKSTMARPVAHATVVLYGKSKAKATSDDLLNYPYLIAQTTTDADGNFQFDVPKGDYMIRIEMAGYTLNNWVQIDKNNENSVFNINYFVDATTKTISIPQAATSTADKSAFAWVVYPNPVTDVLYVEKDNDQPGIIRIYNTLGQVVQQGNMNTYKTTVHLDSLPSGIYVIRLETGGKIATLKFVKK